MRFGVFTDPHYAEREPRINRYYSESHEKVAECIDLMNEQKVDFLIELGDLKDEGVSPKEEETLQFLTTMENELQRFNGPVYHVLGNHDHDSISKQQFLEATSNEGDCDKRSYYSFDREPIHFIVLDANYTSAGKEYDHGNFDWKDAHVPEFQLSWLKKDLKENNWPTIIFIHHRLDSVDGAYKAYSPDNADIVRKVLEDSGNVIAVFQGHYHEGGLTEVNGIHYCTLKAVVEGSGPENNNYAIVEIGEDQVIRLKGYRKTKSQEFGKGSKD